MKRRLLAGLLVSAAVVLVVGGATALAKGGDDGGTFRANLNGYNEVVGAPGPGTGSISTGATGTFVAKVRGDRLDFTLTYRGIEGGTVTQAHPHFAQEHVAGDIFGFLCGGPKPACPTPSGTVSGTWTSADILGPAGQGVEAGAFAKFVRALRAGAVYVNVHSTRFPEGEIRGQVQSTGDDNGKKSGDDNGKKSGDDD